MPASAYTLKLRSDVETATDALAAAQAALFDHLDAEAAHPECVSLKEAAYAWGVEYRAALKRCQRNPHLYIKLPDGRWMVPRALLPATDVHPMGQNLSPRVQLRPRGDDDSLILPKLSSTVQRPIEKREQDLRASAAEWNSRSRS